MEDLTHHQKGQIFEAYLAGIVDEGVAEQICGFGWFMTAKENHDDPYRYLRSDLRRYLDE